jgi:hypothetical protein
MKLKLMVIGFIFVIWVVSNIFYSRWKKKRTKRFEEILDRMKESFSETVETRRRQLAGPPTHGDCVLYYRRYLEKFEKRRKQTWDTREKKPTPFEVYRENARRYGWRYLYSSVADLMVGTPFSPEGVQFVDFGGSGLKD